MTTIMSLIPEINMHSFVRINYTSKKIKEEWAPKLRKAADAYYELEIQTVAHGLRRATTRHVKPENLDDFCRNLAKKGLVYLPLRKIGDYAGFSHYHPPVMKGQPWSYYGIVARSIEDANVWAEAESSEGVDHKAIGDLLGYPKCCQDFFTEVWGAGFYDPVWQQAEGTAESHLKVKDRFKIRTRNNLPWQTNAMLRYIGVRIVPHIACSLDCKHTIEMANQWLALGKELELDGIEELEQLLSMNISWDALKGIAIIQTPIFKLATNSMTCYPNYVVEREGTFYPEGAPTAVKFPWLVAPTTNKILELRRLQAEGKVPHSR